MESRQRHFQCCHLLHRAADHPPSAAALDAFIESASFQATGACAKFRLPHASSWYSKISLPESSHGARWTAPPFIQALGRSPYGSWPPQGQCYRSDSRGSPIALAAPSGACHPAPHRGPSVTATGKVVCQGAARAGSWPAAFRIPPRALFRAEQSPPVDRRGEGSTSTFARHAGSGGTVGESAQPLPGAQGPRLCRAVSRPGASHTACGPLCSALRPTQCAQARAPRWLGPLLLARAIGPTGLRRCPFFGALVRWLQAPHRARIRSCSGARPVARHVRSGCSGRVCGELAVASGSPSLRRIRH